jgi:hypothetical protein
VSGGDGATCQRDVFGADERCPAAESRVCVSADAEVRAVDVWVSVALMVAGEPGVSPVDVETVVGCHRVCPDEPVEQLQMCRLADQLNSWCRVGFLADVDGRAMGFDHSGVDEISSAGEVHDLQRDVAALIIETFQR